MKWVGIIMYLIFLLSMTILATAVLSGCSTVEPIDDQAQSQILGTWTKKVLQADVYMTFGQDGQFTFDTSQMIVEGTYTFSVTDYLEIIDGQCNNVGLYDYRFLEGELRLSAYQDRCNRFQWMQGSYRRSGI